MLNCTNLLRIVLCHTRCVAFGIIVWQLSCISKQIILLLRRLVDWCACGVLFNRSRFRVFQDLGVILLEQAA
jgi:hypothetical protein